MPESEFRRSQAILNLNAYSPSEIQEAIEKVGVTKVDMPFLPCFMLSVVAGGSIGFGALYYTIVLSDADLSFAVTRLLGRQPLRRKGPVAVEQMLREWRHGFA